MNENLNLAPGSVVVVRDEEWLVTSAEQAADGLVVRVRGLSELVRGTHATFYEALDSITPLDPRDADVTADGSSNYRRARLWLEATLRKTSIPLTEPRLSVAGGALADSLEYQQLAVRKALSPDNLRPRILLADAVGLGKTLEIGMILAELIRRGRGDRILIVCPRHVLEQTQHEMWSRFAIPFVRLDSVGVQRVKQKIPATRNPFTYFNKVIVSIDTLKGDRFAHDLRKHHWDAVVIDESHNVTNSATQNNRLARTLAPRTDALILASATPHNGRNESFAELVRLLEPTAVHPHGDLDTEALKRLVVRRHRHSTEVAQVVGHDWAERKPPQHKLIDASPAEDAVASELSDVWLHPDGEPPYSGATAALFPWTLAKAFLSSPAALHATITNRIARLDLASPAALRERRALQRLSELNAACFDTSSKYQALLSYLGQLNVKTGQRAVVFAERVPTLLWLQEKLRRDLHLPGKGITVLHGGISDVEQQEIVESFKQSTSPIRVLVTGDIASEGVNLHKQCSELIHYDIPWSLIRIEQRNGRIDRYGQTTPPQITTLLLSPAVEEFSGDVRILSRLLEKEEQAHSALGDAASLMGSYSVDAEENEIKRVLAGRRDFDEAVPDVADVINGDSLGVLLALLDDAAAAEVTDAPLGGDDDRGLYPNAIDFLDEALHEYYEVPSQDPDELDGGGVRWRRMPDEHIATLVPPADLRQRLDALPQSYLHERRVRSELKLATSRPVGKQLLESALSDSSDSSWPEAHYLGPLHPILDWAADRALARLSRNSIFAVRGAVEHPTVLLLGTLTNRRSQVVAASWIQVEFPNPANPHFALPTLHGSATDLLQAVGILTKRNNPGPVADVARYRPLIAAAVDNAYEQMDSLVDEATRATEQRIATWNHRTSRWQHDAAALVQRTTVTAHRVDVNDEAQLIEEMRPQRRLIRPLLLVLPADHPSELGGEHAQQ